MPFGKYKGVRVRLIPDSYLSWMTTSAIVKDPQWWWIKESVLAELRYRGFRADLADTQDPDAPIGNTIAPLPVPGARKFRL